MKRLLFFTVFVFSNIIAAQTAETLYLEAERLHAHGEYTAAIEMYNKILATDPGLVEANNNRGNSYLELKEYQKALADYELFLKEIPDNPDVWKNKGVALIGLQKYTEAMIALDKAIALNPESYSSYANKIYLFMLMNQDANAKKTADDLKAKYPQAPESYGVSATYYRKKNDYYMVMQELNTAISKGGKSQIILFERASLKDELGDDKGAIADYDLLIKLDAGNSDYFHGRANCYDDLKEYDKAIADCNQAIALDAYNYNAYTLRANIEDTMGLRDKAIADYEKAISVSPSREFAYLELSTLYDWEKNYEKALESVERYLKVNPDSYNARLRQADFAGKSKHYQTAIDHWDALIKTNPDFFAYSQKALCEEEIGDMKAACTAMQSAHRVATNRDSEAYVTSHNYLFNKCRNLYPAKLLKVFDLSKEAVALYDNNDLPDVIKKYDEMIAIVPDSAALYLDRGQFKRGMEDYEGAIRDYKKALTLDKKLDKARSALGVALVHSGKNDEAIAVYLEAIKLGSTLALDYHNLGFIYFQRNEYTKAIPYFEKAIEKDTQYAHAYFNLALCYLKTGDKDKACYYLKFAEKLGWMEARVKRISECG